jgi:hypothetical protein
MSSFWNFLFGFILVVIWIVSGGFVTEASVFLTPYKSEDVQLNRAYVFTFWAGFVTWFLVAVFIILVILSVIGVVSLFGSGVGEAGIAAEGAEGANVAESSESRLINKYGGSGNNQQKINYGISWFTILFLIFAIILVSVTGILSVLAAYNISKSPKYDPSVYRLKKSYDNCVISSSLCIGAISLLIIGVIVFLILGYERKRKYDEENKKIEQKRQTELSELQKLKQMSLLQRLKQQEDFKEKLKEAEEVAILNKISNPK